MIFLVLALMLFHSSCQQSNEWNGIRVLKSTRSEVENILGKPTISSVATHAASYETKEARVFVAYTSGSCAEKQGSGWNVPDLTVFEIAVEPKIKPRLLDLKIDMSKYRITPDPEITHLVDYVNIKDGTTITVDKDQGVVQGIRYYPREIDNSLRCKRGTD